MSIDPRLKAHLVSSSGGLLDLRGAELSGLDLSEVNLEGALLMGASLRGACLRGAQLFGAQLMGADLSGADLRGANLAFAHLQGALLINCDLRGAILEHASLDRVVVEGVQLRGAMISRLSAPFFEAHAREAWLTFRDGWCCKTYEWGAQLSERERARPPLIALHGMTGSGRDFQELASLLKRPVLSFDLYGHGESPHCPLDEELSLEMSEESPSPLSFEALLSLTERWLLELLERRVAPGLSFELLGYSMGGRLALSLVDRWCEREDRGALERLERLTLIGVNPGLEDPAERARRWGADQAWAARMESEPLEQVLSDWDAQPILARLSSARPELSAALKLRRARQDPVGLACAMRAVSVAQMPSLWGRLERISCPTRWVAGGLDEKYRALSERAARAQGALASLHLVPEAGHSPQLERPEALASLWSEL